jgi:hypothetical protein
MTNVFVGAPISLASSRRSSARNFRPNGAATGTAPSWPWTTMAIELAAWRDIYGRSYTQADRSTTTARCAQVRPYLLAGHSPFERMISGR